MIESIFVFVIAVLCLGCFVLVLLDLLVYDGKLF